MVALNKMDYAALLPPQAQRRDDPWKPCAGTQIDPAQGIWQDVADLKRIFNVSGPNRSQSGPGR